MAEEKPGLHIDLDWKKQAQEEKKRLEEEEKKRAEERASAGAATTPTAVVPGVGAAGAVAPGAAAGSRRSARAAGKQGRELPPASIGTLAQSLVTQTLYYLSDQAARTGDEMANMDMAKHLIDTMGVLEDKTQGHLTEEERTFLDTALYEARMRFIAVAGQVIAGA
jgi:hypothetical protein